MKKLFFIILVIFISLSACEKYKIEGEIKNNPKLAQELRESPEFISLSNNNLRLSTYLWRDFMPIAEQDGSKLYCVNWLTDVDSISISSSIYLNKQYVIKNNEVWVAAYNTVKNKNDVSFEGFVENGPKWGPNIEVDVVCEFELHGQTYKILAKSQSIHRTD